MVRYACIAVLVSAARAASADVCMLNVTANEHMRFEQQTMEVVAGCTDIEVTLHNASDMEHDWVLAKTADVTAVADAGMSAGLDNDYQEPGDARIVAATKFIGGGATGTVRFSTQKLEPGGSYTYFCTAPGHFRVMKGRLVYGAVASSPVASIAAPVAKNVAD